MYSKNFDLKKQTTEKLYGDDWSNTAVKYLNEIRENAIDESGKHQIAIFNCKKMMHYYANLITLIVTCSAFAGVGVSICSSLGASKYWTVTFSAFTTAFSIIAGYFNKLEAHYNYSEKAALNSIASSRFDQVVDYIDKNLYLPPKKRPDVQVVIEGSQFKISSAREVAPDLSQSVSEQYYRLNPERQERKPLEFSASYVIDDNVGQKEEVY